MKLLILLLSISFLFAGCATSNLGTNQTARSLPKGESKVDLVFHGYGDPNNGSLIFTPLVQGTYGLSDTFDISLRTEFESLTLAGKYSVLDQAEGLSAALQGGLVFIGGRLSYFFGGLVSYRHRRWEPYLGARYNILNYDSTQFDGNYFAMPPGLRWRFPSVVPGVLFWLTPTVSVGAEMILVLSGNNSVALKQSQVYGVSFSYLF